MNIFLTLIILFIAAYALWFVWTKNIDYWALVKSKLPAVPLKVEEPIIGYGLTTLSTPYQTDQKVDDILWRGNYSKHLFTITNTSSENLSNVIISLSLPAGIVSNKIESQVNVFNVSISSFNQPITLGNISFEKTISNSIDISIEKLNKHSTLTISFVMDYRNKPKECWNSSQCFWQSDISFEYQKNQNKTTRKRTINPIKIVEETPLTLKIDKADNFVNLPDINCTQDTYPFSPIVSKPDGSFVQLTNFKGDFASIQLNKGEGLIMSMGIDYTVNSDENFKK